MCVWSPALDEAQILGQVVLQVMWIAANLVAKSLTEHQKKLSLLVAQKMIP